MTHTLETVTYSSVVTKKPLCIALTMAALDDLEICIQHLCDGTKQGKVMDSVRFRVLGLCC